MGLYMESTEIPAEKTAGELTAMLAMAGANKVMTEYGPDREASGVTFSLTIDGGEVPFRLPIRIDPIFTILQKRKRPEQRERYAANDKAQAKRTAWRQVLRWVQAQLAMIETGMVESREVFLPYAVMKDGATLYELVASKGMKLLPMQGGGK